MAHLVGFDVVRQFASDVAGSIIQQQARPVMDMGLVAP